MNRRRFLLASGGLATALLSGCASNDSGSSTSTATQAATASATPTATVTETATRTPTETETETPTETSTPRPEPDFDASIEAPDSIETGERLRFEVIVQNDGGPGRFSSPISVRVGGGRWFTSDPSAAAEFERPGSKVVYENSVDSIPAPTTIEVRVDDLGVRKRINVEWGGAYARARSNAQSPTYDEFFRNFEQYKGQAIHFDYGSLYQTLYNQAGEYVDFDYYQMQVTNNQEQYEGDIAADYYGDDRLLENDVIEVWGVAESLYSYETVQGDTRTIPRITLTDYELRDDGGSY